MALMIFKENDLTDLIFNHLVEKCNFTPKNNNKIGEYYFMIGKDLIDSKELLCTISFDIRKKDV